MLRPSGASASSAPDAAPEELGPSLVYLEQISTGYLRDAATGRPLTPEPLVVRRRCSGVVVNPDGYVATTTVCVRPSDAIVLVNALYRYGRDQVAAKRLAPDRLDAFVTAATPTSMFTGAAPGSRYAVGLLAQTGVATPELVGDPAVPATVVGSQPPDAGNVALVRLGRTGLPAVELGGSGAPAAILGYARSPNGTYAVRGRSVTVTGRTGTGRLGLTGDVGPDSRGGAVVDATGRLVGLLDTDPSANGEPVHDVVDPSHLTRLLARHGVPNRLADVDRAYRTGLDAYFHGRYSAAVAGFSDVLRRDGTRTAAVTYRDRARDRLATEGNATPNAADWGRYALSAALGTVIVVALLRLSTVVRVLVRRHPG